MYHAVGNRCALQPASVPMEGKHARDCLVERGYKVLEVDIVALARERIGCSRFVRGVAITEAPGIVDCSSFTKWLFAQKGIRIPRQHIEQRALGVPVEEPIAGDLVFTTGFHDCYESDPNDGVGHVGVISGEGTVIHASGKRREVIETPLDVLLSRREFRGYRRFYFPQVLTVECPFGSSIETSEDLKWLLRASL